MMRIFNYLRFVWSDFYHKGIIDFSWRLRYKTGKFSLVPNDFKITDIIYFQFPDIREAYRNSFGFLGG